MHKWREELVKTLRLTFPIVISQLGVIMMNVSDNLMVGKMLGKQALAAAGLANSVAFLIASMAIGGLPVMSPQIAKFLSSNDQKTLEESYVAAFSLTSIMALGLSFLGLLFYVCFGLLGQSEEISNLSKPFFVIILLSNIPLYYFLGLKQISDGYSKTIVILFISFFGLLVNIGFNYLLIKKFGINGAAWSTFIVRVVMLICLLLFLHFRLNIRSYFRLQYTKLTATFLRLSIPGGFQFLFEIGAFSMAVIMMGWVSENALAAHQIAINIVGTTYMMAAGIGYAGAIRVGDRIGQKDWLGVILSIKVSFFLVFLFMSTTMFAVYYGRTFLAHLYINNEEVIAIATSLLIIAAIFQLSDGVQVVALSVLRGLSDVDVPAAITLVAYWILALPVGYYLGIYLNFGAEGIWYGLLIGLSFAAIFLSFRVRKIIKKSVAENSATDSDLFNPILL